MILFCQNVVHKKLSLKPQILKMSLVELQGQNEDNSK